MHYTSTMFFPTDLFQTGNEAMSLPYHFSCRKLTERILTANSKMPGCCSEQLKMMMVMMISLGFTEHPISGGDVTANP